MKPSSNGTANYYLDLLYFSKSIRPTGNLLSFYHNWQKIVQLVFNVGRSRNFTGNKYFSIGVDSATCKIEGLLIKPKNGSEVRATPLIGHLKTSQMKTPHLKSFELRL